MQQKSKSLVTLVCCAMSTAIAVILARLISFIPNEFSRISIESIPIFVSGMLFGPIQGMAVGFASDLIGCFLSPFGYNPLLCLPPIICGLCGGLFRRYIVKSESVLSIAVGFFPYILFASIFWQSFALALVYGEDNTLTFFVSMLTTRSIQFAITFAVDVLLVWLLVKSGVFKSLKLWPKIK